MNIELRRQRNESTKDEKTVFQISQLYLEKWRSSDNLFFWCFAWRIYGPELEKILTSLTQQLSCGMRFLAALLAR